MDPHPGPVRVVGVASARVRAQRGPVSFFGVSVSQLRKGLKMAWSQKRKIASAVGVVGLGALGFGAYKALDGRLVFGLGVAAVSLLPLFWARKQLNAASVVAAFGGDPDQFADPCAYAGQVAVWKKAATFTGTRAHRDKYPLMWSNEMTSLIESCAAS